MPTAQAGQREVRESLGALGTPTEGSAGKYRIRIIEGDRWGSSGYYPASVIERDGPRVFAAGTQMFLDHPTATEEMYDRPERSVRDLIGIIDSTPEWNASNKSLEADVRFFSGYAGMIQEIAPHIGISINAYASMEEGSIEGQYGDIITNLIEAKSVDVVTKAGAGGAIISAIESATKRTRQRVEQPRESAVADTTISADTLTSLTTAMTSLTEALGKEAKAREDARTAAEAAVKQAADRSKPDPLDVALALAEAKLPKAYASRVVEAVKGGTDAAEAVKAAEDELAEVLKESGAVKPTGAAPIGKPVGAPVGQGTTGRTANVGYGSVDISESHIDSLLGRFATAKGN